MSLSSPPVPECLTRKTHLGALRARHVSRGHSRREFPRIHPSPPRVPRGRAERTPPGYFPSAPRAQEPTPRNHPRHSTSTPRVPGSVFFFRRILENTQKIVRTLEMHNKSIFDPKNMIPIFM